MSRVLITGVAGFLGARLARRMVQDGWEVVGLDLVPRVDAWRLEGVKLEYRWGACQDLHVLDAPYVVHLASQGDVPLALSAPAYTVNNNVMGTLALLEAAKRHDGLQRLVLQSSEEVYGYGPVPAKEEQSLNPTNIYGCSKAMQELMTMSYFHCWGLPMTILRSSTLIGCEMRMTQVLPIFIGQALRDEPLTVQGDGRQTRDFNPVDNHLDALLAALTTPRAVGRIINVGSGQERTIASLAQECIRATGSRSTLQFEPHRPGEKNLRVWLDISLARELLNYTPKVSFEEELERMCGWLGRELGVTPPIRVGSPFAATTLV